MAVNRAFEPNNDELDDRPKSGRNSPNVPIDTYFSEEKVRIPDRVSGLSDLTNHIYINFRYNISAIF